VLREGPCLRCLDMPGLLLCKRADHDEAKRIASNIANQPCWRLILKTTTEMKQREDACVT
jgi:hypothetical protein